MDEALAPPPHPPPLLNDEDLEQLMEHGFLPITLPPRLAAVFADLDRSMAAFFEHDEATKQAAYPAAQSTELGYYVVEGEKEYVTLRSKTANRDTDGGRTRPDDDESADGSRTESDELRARLEGPAAQLWQQTATLMYRVLMQISDVLSIPHAAWDPVLDGCMALPGDFASATPSLMRLFRYEPERGVAGKHTDNGLLTLCVGAEKGLQTWRKRDDDDDENGGDWEDAAGPTLLLGTTLKVLSSGRVAAGAHQVVANARGRRSIVFAWRPSTRHVLDLEQFGGEGTWDLNQMWQRITSRRVNVNANRALRAEQQAKREERLARAKVTMGMA